ncbi:radical SAM/SPASM domain-containing protein [Indioceanicola profundi]|uniref:radical SAM/SPASM domain-containing protein n=1 Tax=Indioceanicola profundi TaxID=2220096 RepID=UPI000E6ABCF2|nr:radical SAM protein [Indioceanicola profundi]
MFRPSFPLHFVFILGYKCNLACTHCSSNADSHGSLGYSTAEAQAILRQMSAVGVVDVAFSGGEPLLRRDLEELIRFARDEGMSTGTSTNGYPMTGRRARSLKVAGLDRLQVSLDGTREAHERVRGSGAFDHAVGAIRRSLDAGLRTHICFTAMRSNAHLLPEIIGIALELGVHGFNLSQFVPTGRGAAIEALAPSTAKRLLEIWLDAKIRHPELHLTAHSSGLAALSPDAGNCRGGCQAGISIGCIAPTGDVTPCVMFPLSLGNLKERPLAEIWSTSPTVRTLKSREVSGACGTCAHRMRCGGCRAGAWAMTGDMMAEDPSCWLADGTASKACGSNRRGMACRTSSSTPHDLLVK